MPPRQNAKARASIGSTHHIHGDESRVIKLPGNLRDWQVRCVCGETKTSCNNGWMRIIENQAIPILTPMINGNNILLYPHHQKVIATWAALKFMISEYDLKSPVTVHHSHRKFMFRHKLPPTKGWAIWISSFEKVNWVAEWVCRPVPMVYKKMTPELANVQATFQNACANTQIIGKLFIHIIHTPVKFPIERWRFPVKHRGTLLRIWPPANTVIRWPCSALDDASADRIVEAFFNWCVDYVRYATGIVAGGEIS